MTHTQETPPDADNSAGIPQTPPTRWHGLLFAVIGVVGVIFGNQLFSNEWACAVVPTGFTTLIVLVLVHPRVPARGRGIARDWPLAAALVAGIAIGSAVRVGSDAAFRECFDTDIPATVRNLRVVGRHYAGGGGDYTLIIEFFVSEEDLAALLALGKFTDSSDRIDRWRAAGGTWQSITEGKALLCMLGYADQSWAKIEPMQEFEVWESTSETHMTSNLLLWEQTTGRVVVLSFCG